MEVARAACGVNKLMDDGFVAIDADSATTFVQRCRELRHWPRQQTLNGHRQAR